MGVVVVVISRHIAGGIVIFTTSAILKFIDIHFPTALSLNNGYLLEQDGYHRHQLFSSTHLIFELVIPILQITCTVLLSTYVHFESDGFEST